MPPKKNSTAVGGGDEASGAANSNGKVPTENEMKFFSAVMSNLNTKVDANWEDVATAMSLKDAKCAKERYRQIKLKFGWIERETGSPGSGSGAATPPGSGSRRKTAKTAAAGAAAADGPVSPTKVTKRRTPAKGGRGKKAVAAATSDLNMVVKAEEGEDAEENDEAMADDELAEGEC